MCRSKKTILFVFIFLNLLILPIINSSSSEHYHFLVDYQQGGLARAEQSDTLENYLQNSIVPGLAVTYREVIDAIVEDGQHAFLTGGVIRDLLGPNASKPHDVDLDYSGTADQLAAILEEKGWKYTRLPNSPIIIIGDNGEGSIDAMPIPKDGERNDDNLEFTINNILYYCNNREFTPGSEVGLTDLSYGRLNILAKKWENWIYQPQGNRRYYKIFRFWKMVGKGYLYQNKFADFINEETSKVLEENPEKFFKELLKYISKHMYCYNDIYRGSLAIMGSDWTVKNLGSMKDEALRLEIEFDAKIEKHTYFGFQK